MEPKWVLACMRGYGTMIVRHFNGGMDPHCSTMRQAAGPGLRRANTKDEEGRNGWESIMQLTTKNPQRWVQLSLFIMISALELLHRFTWTFVCIVHKCASVCPTQFSSYLSVVCRAMLWRSFSSLTFVCRHFSSSVSFLTACSAFHRLSLSWSRSSTIVWTKHKYNWTIKQYWRFLKYQ